MKTQVIRCAKRETSRVTCRKNVLERALPAALAAYGEVFLFTDETVFALYGKKVRAALGDIPVFAIPQAKQPRPAASPSPQSRYTAANPHK